MKNKTKINRKIAQILTLVIAVTAIFYSCETEIPDTDSVPPTFIFRISGDGFERDFNQDTDFESFQLNLRTGVEYDFAYSVGDDGGLKNAFWYYNSELVEFITPIPTDWKVLPSGLGSVLAWQGDSANPLTGTILAGTFKINNKYDGLLVHNFQFWVQDFGGATDMTNDAIGYLNIATDNHPTAVINF